MPEYNFPELSVADIVQQFHNVFPDLGVCEEDFKGPKVCIFSSIKSSYILKGIYT